MPTKDPFPKVKEAREALKEKALELYQLYMDTIMQAKMEGKVEYALEHLQWLVEHMPAEEGVRLIDPSAAKQPKLIDAKPAGPTVQIGIALGGMSGDTKALPLPKVIEVTDPNDSDPTS